MFFLRYIVRMLPYIALAFPVLVVWRVIAVKSCFKKGVSQTTVCHEVGVMLISLFLVGLASQTILPGIVYFDGTFHIFGPFISTEPYYNLVPFVALYDAYRGISAGAYVSALTNIGGNIVMFMPIGFFLPLLHGKISAQKAVLIGFCISLVIELLQIPMFGRCTDIDDLLLNTLGTFMGALLSKQVQKRAPSVALAFKVKYPTL